MSLIHPKISTLLKYFFLFALIFFPLFGFLDTLSIRQWDESRIAINTLEMHLNNNFIVTYFRGEPDMWNTKPPLLIWMQLFWVKIIGPQELAFRLPSALASLFLCGFITYFSVKQLKSYWLGLFTSIVLVTTHGYVTIHGTRTGDYESLLILFTTVYILFFYLFLEKKKNKYLYYTTIFIALAILTKSITGLIFLPALLIWTITQKALLPLLKNKHFYGSIACCLTPVLAYYFLRESINPGYIDAVLYNDVFGRYQENLHEKTQSIFFYFTNFWEWQFSYWIIFLPLGIASSFFIKNIALRKFCAYIILCSLFFLFIISSAQSKYEWYSMPVYPFLAFIVAFFFYFLYTTLLEKKLKISLIVLFVTLFYFPIKESIYRTYKQEEKSWSSEFYEIAYFLKSAQKGNPPIKGLHILDTAPDAHMFFYNKLLGDNQLPVIMDLSKISVSKKYVVFKHEMKEYINANYNYTVHYQKNNVDIVHIHSKKQIQ